MDKGRFATIPKLKIKRLPIVVGVLILLLAISPFYVSIYREYRHERLNYDLVLAIKEQDSDRALALLRAGADAAVRQADGNPLASGAVFTRSLARLFHTGGPLHPQVSIANNPGILRLFYKAALDSEHGRHSAPTNTAPTEALPLALLKAGAPIDQADSGTLCLYGAVHYHHHNVVMHLLDCGVDAGALTPRGLATLMDANADDVQALISHGADIEMRDEDGNTALFRADSLKAVTLLNLNAQLEARNTLGQTPLIYNCVAGNDDAVLVLLARFANVATCDLHGTTPFLAAAAHCRLETLKALAHAGADIHAKKRDGTTALMYALYNPDDRVFAWLLSRSPDLNARGLGDNTALGIAVQLRDQAKARGEAAGRYDKAINELRK
jgi:ankyrin repeat protein